MSDASPVDPAVIEALEAAWTGSKELQYAWRWLYKDGLETGFYQVLDARAPRVTRALAERGHFKHFVEYTEALRLPDKKAREDRLAALEKMPGATWDKTRPRVRPEDLPLLEAWIDRCANAEGRGSGAPVSSAPKARRARHQKFGPGTVLAISEQTATVRFDDGVERKLRVSFLQLEE